MASTRWIFVSCLLVLVGTEFTNKKCEITEEKLYILADLTTHADTSFTIIQVSDFIRLFDSYRKDDFKDLDVHLIEPFQEKSIHVDQYNDTKDKLISAINIFGASNRINRSIYTDYSDLSKALNYAHQVIRNETSRSDHVKDFIVAGFFTCDGYCQKTVQLFKTRNATFGKKQLILFLTAQFRELDTIYYEENFIYVHNFDIEREYYNFTNILILFCQSCPEGWLSHKDNKTNFSNTCYKVFKSNPPLNWFDAKKSCGRINAHLPVIETTEELVFVNKILHNYNLENELFPLKGDVIPVGLTKRYKAIESFQWINGRPFVVLTKNVVVDSSPNPDCGAFYYAKEKTSKNISAVGEDEISWVMRDCKRIRSRTILCESSIENYIYYVNKTVPNNISSLIKQIIRKQQNEFFVTKDNNSYMFSLLSVPWSDDYNNIFDCKDGGTKLFYNNVCNNKLDCENGRDEIHCAKSEDDRFVFEKKYCDDFHYISNEGYEDGCNECMGRRCSDGTCVPRHWLSRNGETCLLNNTTDGIMFLNVSQNCRENCNFIAKFIHEIVICNSRNGLKKSQVIFSNNLNILSNITWAPKCLYIRGHSGNPLGCSEMTHLDNCENFECPDTFFKCHNSFCISIYMINDKIMDCAYGEDEFFDDKFIGNFLFDCKSYNLIRVLHPLHVCDGITQCPLGDDELNCNFKCPRGFWCKGGGVVAENYSEIGVIESFEIFDLRSRYLNVSGIDLSNIKKDFDLPNLLELQATHCNISNVELIFKRHSYPLIFSVNLSYNNIFKLDNYGSLRRLNNLQILSLAANRHLSILDNKMVDLINVHTLDISFTNISVLEIHGFSSPISLRYLNLFNTKIKKIIMQTSFEMNLNFLDIRQNLLPPINVIDLLKAISVKEHLYTDNFKYCCPQIIGSKTPRHVCHAPSDGISSCEDLLGDVLKRSLLWLVAIISICLNLIVLIFRTVYERGVFKKGYGVFITNLGVSDFIMGVYLLIIAAVDVNFRDSYVLHEADWRHSIVCKTAGFLSTLSSETSTFFVVLITLDRFLVIRFPFGEYRLTKWVIIISAVTSWVIGFSLALIPIVYHQWTIYSSNAMCLGLPLTTSRQQGWQYAVGVFIVLNCILFLCIALGQVSIFLSMARKRMTCNIAQAARREQDITVAKQLFLIALSNFLCWCPICVIGLSSLNGYEASPDTYAWLVIFVLPLNAAVNPLIYTIPVLYKKWLQFKRGVGR